MALPSTIAVDGRTLTYRETGERGIGTFTVNHLKAWSSAQTDARFKLLLEKDSEMVRGTDLLKLNNVSLSFYSLSGKEFEDVDLFHVPDPMSLIGGYDAPFRMVPGGIRCSAMFHDLIPLVMKTVMYDQWPVNLRRAYDVRLAHLKESGALVLANSNATKTDLVIRAGFSPSNIHVILAGLNRDAVPDISENDIQKTKQDLGINKPYLLVVGGIDDHKGFMHTLEACLELLTKGHLQLVIVGSMVDPWKVQFKAALEAKNVPGVIFTDFISDIQLSSLYAGALALSFPSEYEGFGFPVLEAMAHGCPVICSNRASLPEVAGDCAIYLEEISAKGVFDAIRKLMSSPDLRKKLQEGGRERAKLFTWENTAQKTIAALSGF